jgi:Family of unknown function (DUF6603)
MPDLDAALLDATLGFASRRLDALLQQIAPDPPGLLTALLGHAPSQQQLTALQGVPAVQTHLTDAAGHATTVRSALTTAPENLAAAAAVAAELAAALAETAAAVGAVEGAVNGAPAPAPGMQSLLRQAVARVSEGFGGLVEQLGLPDGGAQASTALAVAGTTITYRLTNASTRTIVDPIPLSLHDSTFTATLNWTNPASLRLTLQTGVRAGVAADGFVQKLVPPSAAVDAPITVVADTVNGLTLGAGSKHRVSLPQAKLDLPGIQLHDVRLELPDASELAGTGGTPGFAILGSLSGHLGPVSAVIDGTGIAVEVDPNAVAGGAASPASPAVRPPDGAGLDINAGVVHGGGYLSVHDGQYGGALDLSLEVVEIKAVGLITPDPFSLVLVLSIEFLPPIQLSFGFTLNGVGGLLALERVVATDPLRAGIRNHTADVLLFPKDPVAAAPKILSALAEDFPREPGGFVVGPIVEIGWGTPVSYVTAKVGVIISLPDPKIILLGAVRVALPLPDAPIVDLRAEVYGEITPEHLLFLVSLQGSQVAGFPVNGDFGLLIGFGDDPEFALSAGGFHPHYKPPGELAGMRRVSIDISPPAILRMRTESYFALTSNSFQLGAFVQLRADVGGAGAEGHLGFDALVRWAPTFSFEVEVRAGISLYVEGITFASVELHLDLSGPAPWSAHGTASVSILFFDFDFDVGPITWGDAESQPVDAVSPAALVADALRKPEAWHGTAPDQGDRVARLRQVEVANAILVHPLGAFELRQHVVPLETHLDRIGQHPVSEPRVDLGGPTIGALPARAVSETTDRFAPGQFLDLSDDEKLSRPGFESLPSGMRLAGAAADTHTAPVQSVYQWDTVFPHEEALLPLRYPVQFLGLVVPRVLAAGPAARGALQNAQPYGVKPEPVGIAESGTVVVRGLRDLQPVAGISSAPMTTTAAARAVADLVASDPSLAGTMQLVGPGIAP